MKQLIIILLLSGSLLNGQDFSKLPGWAAPHAAAAVREPAPADADAWVLLDRTEIAYVGDGEIRTKRLRLVKILTERGIEGHSGYFLLGLGGRASRVRKLKGWNLRPDNELVKLDQDVVAFNYDLLGTSEISTRRATVATLGRVVKGSLVAFESLEEIHQPLGPATSTSIMEAEPIRRWELEVAKQEGWFTSLKQVEIRLDARHFQPWLPKATLTPGQSLMVADVPALTKGEAGCPDNRNMLPWVSVRFLDPAYKTGPSWSSWDTYAIWMQGQWAPKLAPSKVVELKGRTPLEALKALKAWMAKELIYKAVYLTPERGWIPECGPEVFRKRYGDCKDLASFFLSEAKGMGFLGYPANCLMQEGEIEADEPPEPNAFNHAIAALRLETPLGLPAEVETPQGRFLLVDPTDRLAPLGMLHVGYWNRRVLICTEKGGIWVQVPPTAIQVPHVGFQIDGEAEATGRLQATLTITCKSHSFGLREAALGLANEKLREYILHHVIDLPPTGTLEVLSRSEPTELDQPFEVVLKMVHPEGVRLENREWIMCTLGLPGAPGLIQKAGKPRIYPVSSDLHEEWDYHADVKVPVILRPCLPVRHAETPFRTLDWKAEAIANESGCRLHIQFSQKCLGASFDLEHREQGVTEWKKDRAVMKDLLADGLAFLPPATSTPGQ